MVQSAGERFVFVGAEDQPLGWGIVYRRPTRALQMRRHCHRAGKDAWSSITSFVELLCVQQSGGRHDEHGGDPSLANVGAVDVYFFLAFKVFKECNVPHCVLQQREVVERAYCIFAEVVDLHETIGNHRQLNLRSWKPPSPKYKCIISHYLEPQINLQLVNDFTSRCKTFENS